MDGKETIAAAGVVCLTAIVITAMLQGINGLLVASGMSALSGIVFLAYGIKIGVEKVAKKEIKEEIEEKLFP